MVDMYWNKHLKNGAKVSMIIMCQHYLVEMTD